MSVHPPVTAVRDVVERALAEDLGPLGDLTAALLPPGLVAAADIVPRAPGVLAGRLAATETFARVDAGLAVAWSADDGDPITAGTPVARVTGALASILSAERTALNLLGHLSGVATETRRYADVLVGRWGAIRDTRKTTPGLRALEKAAVRAGGGANHRGSLSDGVLLKDNHLAGTTVAEAVARARSLWPGRTVEVECDTAAQVDEAVAAGADLVLLDNMSPAEVADCVAQVRAASAGRHGRARLVEVSGGVTLETVAAYADAGADLISVGALTHSAPVLDIGLDVVT
ncbi:MAG: carboxylating nicotinate-nucleotide diphosphorylase [Acidimicrobiales bacterium]